MPAVIETVDLTRRFGRLDAVEGLNLQVPAGSLFAFLGRTAPERRRRSSAHEHHSAASGKASVLGIDSRHLGPRSSRIGYVSENQELPDWMTVGSSSHTAGPSTRRGTTSLCRKLPRDLDLTSLCPCGDFARHAGEGGAARVARVPAAAPRARRAVQRPRPVVRDELIRALLELTGEHNCTSCFVARHRRGRAARRLDCVHRQGGALSSPTPFRI